MKYPCSLVQDLLPLYYDRICSDESNKIIESHLLECSCCREYYHSLCEATQIVAAPQNMDLELQKAASFRAIRKKLAKKELLVIFMTFLTLLVIFFSIVSFLKNSISIIPYDGNIAISMVNGNLVARLEGTQATYIKEKRVDVTINGETRTCLFFYMSGTRWDDIITSQKMFSEYVLCASDKGAEQIDAVYYFTEDYTEIENMSEDKLQQIIDHSNLLWNK